MSDEATRPFLIDRDDEGNFRLTVRDVRYNSQGYPIVSGTRETELFATAAAAKTWARNNFNAKAGQYLMK
ncbi:MAG: hypothetical protein H6916_06010 [Novosphingobium sp.]|jgi:hypothetical protein|uniref:hypothetical protein n=1 Tax=Novosphingobium sp. TaxID=1874826 RepID=UPI001DA0B63D|nr:hypothetical protein [Novosphingobium sp.]MCB2056509.1 hypothetical protein [Novosphingobium sp.]MCP5386357.1 hypothetical protein [Novosphingobium sp.]HNJ47681.1 hypothetical protein [Novosphingobium sp.]HNN55210.1 hypothetical protein [Novosphingobium sp.]